MITNALKFSKAARNYFSSALITVFVRVLQIYLTTGVADQSP